MTRQRVRGAARAVLVLLVLLWATPVYAADPPDNPDDPRATVDVQINPSPQTDMHAMAILATPLYAASDAFAAWVGASVALITSTPPTFTTDLATTGTDPQDVARLLAIAASAVLLVLVSYQILGCLTRRRRGDVRPILLRSSVALVLIWGMWYVGAVLIALTNTLSASLGLQQVSTDLVLLPARVVPTSLVSFALGVVLCLYWAMLGLITFAAIVRIVEVNLLLMVAPLAGLSVAWGRDWGYTRAWATRLVGTLLTPILWSCVLTVGRAAGDRAITDANLGNGLVQLAIQCCTFVLVLESARLLGLVAPDAPVFTSWAASAQIGHAALRTAGHVVSTIRARDRAPTTARQGGRARQPPAPHSTVPPPARTPRHDTPQSPPVPAAPTTHTTTPPPDPPPAPITAAHTQEHHV